MELPHTFFIVGLPGSGKTTFGKFLASEIGYSFFDLDAVITKGEGKSIAELFESLGEQGFRKVEAEQLRKVPTYRSVISTGGGTPCFHSGMDWMNAHGFTIWLCPPLDEILTRIGKHTHRPLVGKDPAQALKALLKQRQAVYSKSAWKSHSVGGAVIWNELRSYFSR
jgi:shikimate kinase